ncbi:GNAT family N-acetyltransferase [Jiella sp. MQZ9-1]|uniref:GNAT family N-acetyltransferase n=1 Tax=Jiella flava TaxID=2816857 RepID=A0A939JVD5_9HYPH|nr:GNAT family protein [Jiella flava]MBO0662344.1 GNAT family N-acetyltransferase [Jiella flava]MCD2470827.1 GNAT family N-acetyltransferase [Jiella flava]
MAQPDFRLPGGRPERKPLEGRYARLEPLDPDRHAAELWAALAGHDDLYRYLPDMPPANEAQLRQWAETAAAPADPLFFAVVEPASGRAVGRQALMRITPEHGVVEIGSVLWGPGMARSRIATEALFLMAAYVFDDLGYRRFEWKCNERNGPSKRAAERFGFRFEGVFRQHMVVKGENRDTAWFSMLDHEWPRLKAGFEAWLAPDNFDDTGAQRSTLRFDPS